VQRTKPAGTAVTAIIEDLRAGPLPADGPGLRTLVGGGEIVSVTAGPSGLIVGIDPLVTVVDDVDQALIAAQILATLDSRPNSGRVTFTVAGEEWLPPLPPNSGFDYAALIAP
jgi:hypothetical protein